MKIEIWSDVMCPFCYIGKHNFEQALEKLPFKNEIEVEWKSFQLDPTLDAAKPQNTIEYFRQKKGLPADQASQMIGQVAQVGKGAGIDFNFEKALIINTFAAHKLLHLAKKYGKSDEMEDALFKAHFTEGKNVGDIEELVSLAGNSGIDKDEAREVLTTDQFDYDINQDIQEAKNNGISSVPFFVLNGKYAVSGAQPSEVFADALQQTYQETVSPFKNLSQEGGASCDTDGCSI
ncbi:DsbA family oxidoreductase [Chryseobacterium vrystaatense]|uniref:DSBA oxidoreductase n=1 Tax=Chryseobacterium vrystaatense TaxID=307480 RepID=A0ABR4ULK4_9FLAO|nr:DsbA family oxidoreductase [Chryseobacterium vrystaatense]KFF25814.1 DSBA oxidoreductase [Chryseobacterium vrystaatense]